MAANDHGHINNIDRKQTETLKGYWIALTNAISGQSSLPVNQIVDSVYGDELFYAIGYDNPDVFLVQYLRAQKWDINAAVQQMMETLKWRHKWGVQALVAKGESDLSFEEIKTGKGYFMGRDRAGRPITYVFVRDHIKGQFPIEFTEKLAVLIIETGHKLIKTPVETGMLVIDLAGFGMKHMDYHFVKFFINLLQNYYPDSFGLVLFLNAPWIFYGCWAIIKQWLDPAVESAIYFIKDEADLAIHIDPSTLPRRLNGNQPDFEYIPPTAEDEAMMTAFRVDIQGKADTQAAHREAARHYMSVTLQWAHGDDSSSSLTERATVAKQLRDVFEKLVPYISTRTHYHRTGVINEPIFHVTYDRLRASTTQHS